jgi:hypothetical protein
MVAPHTPKEARGLAQAIGPRMGNHPRETNLRWNVGYRLRSPAMRPGAVDVCL